MPCNIKPHTGHTLLQLYPDIVILYAIYYMPYETTHRSKAALCIFFAGSQRRFASAIEATVYTYRHRWKYRSSPFRVNSGIVLRASILFLVQ